MKDYYEVKIKAGKDKIFEKAQYRLTHKDVENISNLSDNRMEELLADIVYAFLSDQGFSCDILTQDEVVHVDDYENYYTGTFK